MANVNCEGRPNPINIISYDYCNRGTYGDCTLAVEGKTIRAHKTILAASSEYFDVSQAVRVKKMFDKPNFVPFLLRNFSKPATASSRSSTSTT